MPNSDNYVGRFLNYCKPGSKCSDSNKRQSQMDEEMLTSRKTIKRVNLVSRSHSEEEVYIRGAVMQDILRIQDIYH